MRANPGPARARRNHKHFFVGPRRGIGALVFGLRLPVPEVWMLQQRIRARGSLHRLEPCELYYICEVISPFLQRLFCSREHAAATMLVTFEHTPKPVETGS